MSYLRQVSRRSFQLAPNALISRRAFAFQSSLRMPQGYGDGKGDPVAENPQDQGRNPKVDQEHPGPPPPSAASDESSGSSTSRPSSKSQSKDGAKPAIHGDSRPQSESADVKKHNEEFEQRATKTHEQDGGEKVDSEFWKGHAGEQEK